MPSKARVMYRDKLLPDVAQLIDTHRQLNPTGRGRRKLGHITRSGVVMLCAAWELYIEEVICEAAEYFVQLANDHNALPNNMKKRLAEIARNHKHDHGPLLLCGNGWRELYCGETKQDLEVLNTPKYGNIDSLFRKWVDLQDFARDWSHTKDKLNEFVRTRGEIAHRGADSDYVSIAALKAYKNMISDLVKETDDRLAEHIRDNTADGTFPWRRTAH